MDRDNLIALREAIDSFSGLVKTITEPTWEEKQALMLVNQQALQSHAANIAKDNMMFNAGLAAEQAGFLAETAGIDFTQADKYGASEKWYQFDGYGFSDIWGDTNRKNTFTQAWTNFEVNHGFYRDNRANVVQSWAYFGKDGEGVQSAIDQATTAISTLKNYRKADEWIDGVDVTKIDSYIAFYEGEIERLQSDPETVRSQRKLPRANY